MVSESSIFFGTFSGATRATASSPSASNVFVFTGHLGIAVPDPWLCGPISRPSLSGDGCGWGRFYLLADSVEFLVSLGAANETSAYVSRPSWRPVSVR